MAGGRPVNQNSTFKSRRGRVGTKKPSPKKNHLKKPKIFGFNGFFEEKNASICYENIELVVVNKILILRSSYNTLFHYYNTLGGRGEGCASDRELDVRENYGKNLINHHAYIQKKIT